MRANRQPKKRVVTEERVLQLSNDRSEGIHHTGSRREWVEAALYWRQQHDKLVQRFLQLRDIAAGLNIAEGIRHYAVPELNAFFNKERLAMKEDKKRGG